MHARIQKWENSLAVRIPRSFAAATGIEEGSAVEIANDDGETRLHPLPAPRYELDELLAQITPEDLHTEINSGQALEAKPGNGASLPIRSATSTGGHTTLPPIVVYRSRL